MEAIKKRKIRNAFAVTAVVLLLAAAIIIFAVTLAGGTAYAAVPAGIPDWCGENKVAISFNEVTLVKTEEVKQAENGYVPNAVFPHIVCGIPGNTNINGVKVRVRTKDGTAIAGLDYTAFDEEITLSRRCLTLSNGHYYYYDSLSIKVNLSVERLIANGQRPYFDVEIYDVLSEGFSISEEARSVRVYLFSTKGKEHTYSISSAYNTLMLDGYLGSSYLDSGSTSSLNIYSEDKSGQTLSASKSYAGSSTYTNDYKKTGLADYFVGVRLHLDEKGVSLSSWCELNLYDGNTSGTHLYHGEFHSIWNDSLYPGIYYEDMDHKNESFADSPNSFKDESEKYGRIRAYYFRISSGTLYETFKSGSNYWRETKGWNLCYIMIDENAPQIKGWYVDKSTLTQGDKIRISIKFNEPVNASASDLANLKLRTKLNGTGGFNNYEAVFSCVTTAGSKGVASDVLTFEFDPSAAKDSYNVPLVGTINNIEVLGFDGFNKVRDYGRNQDNKNNYCGNYTTLAALEGAKMSPRQLNADLKIDFDNRSPVIDQTSEISDEYLSDFTANVTTYGTTQLQGVYYLWSQSPDLNYEKVATPVVGDLDTYYEITDNEIKQTHDPVVVEGKTYLTKRDFNLAEAYTFLSLSGVSAHARYEDVRRFAAFTPFTIGYSEDGNFSTTLSGVSGTYFLHVFARSVYSDETSSFRRIGPIKVDSAAPVFSNITADAALREKTVTANVKELSGLKNVVLYLREVGFNVDDPAAEIRKILIYGTIDDESVTVPEESCQTVVELATETITFRIDAKAHVGLVEENGKSFGDYYFGLVATDIVGNTSELVSSAKQFSFDLRNQFAPFVKIGGVTVTDAANDYAPIVENTTFYAENAYVVDVSEGPVTVVIGRPGNIDGPGDYVLSNAVRYEENFRTALGANVLTGDIYSPEGVFCTDYTINENGNTDPEVSFKVNVPGLYEFTTRAVFGGTESFSRSVRIYVTDGNDVSEPVNYDKIHNVGVNFKNKLFTLSTGRYYARTGTGMGSSISAYYNDSVEPLVFSSKEKASEYVKAMEYRDFYAVRITDEEVRAYNNGTLITERGEVRRPQVGDVWIRYKATTWNFSTNQRDWAYYYYGDSSVSMTIDVGNLSGRLASALEQIVQTIAGKGRDLYLTSEGGVSENGALYVDPVRLPAAMVVSTSVGTPSTSLTYTGSLSNPLEYAFDKEVYYDRYNDKEDVLLVSSYRFSYLNSTKIYYAEAKYDEGKQLVFDISSYKNDLTLLTTPYLTQAAEKSGVYFIRELDESGMRDYFVYVDLDTPTIHGQYKDLDGEMHYSQWWVKDVNDGDVLHTTAFTLALIEDKYYSSEIGYNDYNSYGVDADTYSYVAIFDVTDGGKTLDASFSLHDLGTEDRSYGFPYGVFLVEISDRAGNRFSMTVSVAETPLTSEIEIIKNDKVTFVLPDRTPSELEKVIVTRPGRAAEEIDFEAEAVVLTAANGKDVYALIYTDAGRYEFTVIDKYGYTLSPSTDPDAGKAHTVADLERVNPYNTVKWVTRTDDGRYVDLDKENISLFHSDTYYITSDDKLTFILDSTTIYSYSFTGNVTYQAITRTINDVDYVYVNVDSTERWSVRIYYTLYPGVAATYNRIAKRAVVPAGINLRAQEKDSNGVAQADQTNRIVVYVGTQDELIDNVVVRLKTRDRSAIASLGDYDAVETTVTLTPTNKEQMVTIQTHPSGFSTYNSTTYEFAKRTFDLYIESVEGNADKGRDSIECACPGEQELNIVTKDGVQFFEVYSEGAKHGLPNIAMESKSTSKSEGKYYDYNNSFSVNPSWLSTYVSAGLADLYVTAGMSLSGDDASDYPNLRLTLTEQSQNKQLFRIYLNEIDEDKSVLFGSNYGGTKSSGETYEKDKALTLTENRGNAVAGKYFFVPASSNGNFTLNVHEDEGMIVRYQSDGRGGAYPVYYYVLPGRNVNDALAYSLLVDNTAPTVKSWHVDHSTIHLGETLRLSVRFSEPVYISGKAPYVNANVSGSMQTISFEYAGGAGTDTLYFEFDPTAYTSEINITSISLSSMGNLSSIVDYGYNASKKNNVLSSPDLPRDTEWNNVCLLDTRIPSIDLGNYIISPNPQRNASVPIAIGKTTQGALMEYSWTTESDAPAMYDTQFVLTSSSQNLTLESKGRTGAYYLHIYMKSVYGKVSTRTYGPFLFDNSIPTISGLMVEEATKALKERNVVFYVNDEPRGQASSGIAQVYMYYLFKGEEVPETVKLYDVNNDEKQNLISISENNRVVFLLNYEHLGIPKESQKDVTMAFYAVDGLGNSATISTYTFCPTVVNFDSRSEVEVQMSASKEEFFNADSVPVYNVAGVAPRFDFTFSRQADEYDVRELYIGDKEIAQGDFDRYMDFTADADGVHVYFKSEVIGFVRINFKAVSGTGENHSVQNSSDVVFYLTNGTDKAETYNYVATGNGTLFINKVYMLDSSVYYYHNGEGVRQKNYNDTARPMAFSSRDKAVEYVTYYEMQDLGILEIKTASIASSLNTGDGSYRKAAADAAVNASIGQVWVRYKRATWDNATTSDAWVYYYLGTASEIDPDRLPSSLSAAIAQVTESIVGRGGYRYLTSYDDGLDKNGSPYLDKKQIAVGTLRTFLTNTGLELRTAVSYTGDPGIYDSFVTPAGESEQCSLVTTYNFTYGKFTKLFYTNQVDASGYPIAKEFKHLPEGTVFGSLDIDGGVYWMRECDENGVRDYKVYLDKTAPTLNVTYQNASGDSVDRELDASVDGMSVNGKVLRIKGFSSTVTEIDGMAYVAVFKKNGVLVGVYRAEDIPGIGIEIGEGQYYLEVSDRSGNVYKVSLSLNSTPMEVKVVSEENRYVRINCNRDASEVKLFEIYLDNKLIESNYSPTVTYYQSGVYSIRIEDWFGNTYHYDYELKRDLPKINWFYEENDNYIAYDGSQSCLKITKTSEREYQIVTNKLLMFTYDTSAEYEYEFSDRSVSVTAREFNGNNRVRINDAVDWKLTVRYARYPGIYVVYNCLMDQTAPIINVTARQDIVKYFDAQQIERLNAGGDLTEESAQYFVPDTVYFGVSKTISKAVRNNSTVYSTLLTMQFDDKSICSKVEIYLDGVMIREYTENAGVNNITINRFGEYRIVAMDTLGNKSEFSFANRAYDAYKYIVDGKELNVKLSPADAIVTNDDGEYVYQADAYSYDNAEFMYGGNGKITILIEKDGQKHYLRYECIDGTLYEVVYRLIRQTDEEGNPVYDERDNEIWLYQQTYSATVIPDMSAVEGEKSFVLAEEEDVGVGVSIRFDGNRNVYYHIDAPKHGEATVSVRIAYNDEYQPYFAKTVMSGELPEVVFEHVGEDVTEKRITPTSTEQIVYLNGGFFVAETAFTNITEISVAYSLTTEFTDYRLVYTLNEGYTRIVFTEEGFYSVIAKNIYGRVAKFTVIMSNDLRAVVTTKYHDDTYNRYPAVKGSTYKANQKVTVDVYIEEIEYTLTYNGEQGDLKAVRDPSGMCTIALEEQGVYHLVITDRFRNEIVLDVFIEEKPFTFKTEYLTGYNEDALRKDEGYSNKKLSVDSAKTLADGIKQISVIHNGTETVVYDVLRSDAIPVDADRIFEVIGNAGDGVYVLKMRNEYGNVTEATLHYMGTDTLQVSRLIRTSREAEPIAIDRDAENKVYSNYSVTFETKASKYEIRVDGDKADMPLTLRYPSDGEESGEYKQTVTYIDEYGFKYSFEVNLMRKQLDIDLGKRMQIVTLSETAMTRDDVSIEYEGSVSCDYTLNGGEKIPYTSGELLTADGTYRFYVTDVAGNVHSATVKKDTLVEFTFLYAGTDKVVENGSVLMSGSARFMPVNNDSAKIDLVVLNGEAYDASLGTTYGENGKWEFLVSDDIGNSAYFYFYVVTHALSRFEYESPYAYDITFVEYDAGDGILVSYSNLVKHNANKNNSTMIFEEAGAYQVTVASMVTPATFTFTITIDKTPPKAELVGTVSGQITTKNVTLAGFDVGDTIKVYKDGELIQTILVSSSSTKMPEISEQGEYKIVVSNAAGNETAYEFTRKYTANAATTVVIIVAFLLVAIGLTVVLVLRKRKKV